MKKIIIGALAMAVMATTAMATSKYTGEITYVQVRPDGKVAVKILPDGANTEVYSKFNNTNADKMKAMYAMALTALSTGKKVEIWQEGSYWDTIFLRK